jgi:hypothetical protein
MFVVACTVIVISVNRSTYTFVYISQTFGKPFIHQLTVSMLWSKEFCSMEKDAKKYGQRIQQEYNML